MEEQDAGERSWYLHKGKRKVNSRCSTQGNLTKLGIIYGGGCLMKDKKGSEKSSLKLCEASA